MTIIRKAVLILLPLLFLAGVAVFLFCYNLTSFNGSRVRNPDAYLLDIQRMNGTDLHTLELQKGDVLQIHFETEKGQLYMEIKAPDGTAVYRGNGKETTDFAVDILESGVYTIVVEARHAKGTIHIQQAWSVPLEEDEVNVVHLLCVVPECQGKGVARMTMEQIMVLSREMGKKAVRLDALACNIPAHRLYESLGFQKRDQRRWYADNGSAVKR